MEKILLYDAIPNVNMQMKMKRKEHVALALCAFYFIMVLFSVRVIGIIENEYAVGNLFVFLLISPVIVGTLFHSYLIMRIRRKNRIKIYDDRIILPPSSFRSFVLKKSQTILSNRVEKIYWNSSNSGLMRKHALAVLGIKNVIGVAGSIEEYISRNENMRYALITFKPKHDAFYKPLKIYKENIYDPIKFKKTIHNLGFLEEEIEMSFERYTELSRKHRRKTLPPPGVE